MAVELDAKAFKALSSERRVDILKALAKKPRSLTSLSNELGLSVQATDEHLRKLESAGLVEKSKHAKWTYYALNAKGAALVAPNRQPVYVLLSISVLLLAAAGLSFMDQNAWGQSFAAQAAPEQQEEAVASESQPVSAAQTADARVLETAESSEAGVTESQAAPPEPQMPAFPWTYAFGFSGFGFLLAAVLVWHQQNQRPYGTR